MSNMHITENVNTIRIETDNGTLTLTKGQAFELSEKLNNALENLKHYPDYLPHGSQKKKENVEKKISKKRLQEYEREYERIRKRTQMQRALRLMHH